LPKVECSGENYTGWKNICGFSYNILIKTRRHEPHIVVQLLYGVPHGMLRDFINIFYLV
jgi:hypothetical protein